MYSKITDGIVGGAFVKGLGLHDIALDEKVSAAPGMLSTSERAMLVALNRDVYRGDGAIIDGGSFFGSSLVSSATGLRANPRLGEMDFSGFPGGKPLHGYELGYLPAPASDKIDRRRVFGGIEYILGESFLPILEKTVAPYRDLIELHIGDLNLEHWGRTPIEIAFIDVCKTMRLNAHVSREFYPAMIGGASVLINQDFFFDRLPWIKVTMGYLRDYFAWEGQVFTSSIYTCTRSVPREVADFDPFTEGSCDECLAWHDTTDFPEIDRKYRYYLALSRGYLMALKRRKDDALDYLGTVAEEYGDILDDQEADRGNAFRMERAVRQIRNGNIFKVS